MNNNQQPIISFGLTNIGCDQSNATIQTVVSQPAPEPEVDTEVVVEPEVEQLTTQQLVILFEALLDVSLDSNYTNQSALATLLSRISGYKQSSMRAKITMGIDYDKPQAKSDVAVVAALLDKIRPDLAEKLRNNVAE